jgi:hypothetical protein
MTKKSWHLDRKTFLYGAGVMSALPFLEAFGTEKDNTSPKRLCYLYFANGACVPAPKHEYSWFPNNEGADYINNLATKPLEKYRKDISILGGLSHPKSRELLGHMTGDTWLTAGDVRGDYNNSISIDQVAAEVMGRETRYPYFSFSADGGVGYPTRTASLSYNKIGVAIPTEHRHRKIFERYFTLNNGNTSSRKKSIMRGQKIVDLILDSSRDLKRRLGYKDQQKIDQYMSSLDRVEKQLQKNEAWLGTPLKKVDHSYLKLDVNPKEGCVNYIRTMLDLIALGFQMDITRVIAFQFYREDGMGVGDKYTKFGLGIDKGHHGLSHSKDYQKWAKFDNWMSGHLAYFLDQMKNKKDEYGSLLDNTQILYGSSQSHTHNARNCPLIVAGGKNMGLKHGTYERFSAKIPMSNLFVSMANKAGVHIDKFSDSTGELEAKVFS